MLCSGAESVNIEGTWHVLQHERENIVWPSMMVYLCIRILLASQSLTIRKLGWRRRASLKGRGRLESPGMSSNCSALYSDIFSMLRMKGGYTFLAQESSFTSMCPRDLYAWRKLVCLFAKPWQCPSHHPDLFWGSLLGGWWAPSFCDQEFLPS